MDQYVEVAEKMGTSEAIFNNRPDLVKPRMTKEATATSPAVFETQTEAIARAIGSTKGDVVSVNSEVFNYTDPTTAIEKLGLKDAATGAPLDPTNPKDLKVAKSIMGSAVQKLTPAQLGALGSDQSAGSQARQNNITDSVKSMLDEYAALL